MENKKYNAEFIRLACHMPGVLYTPAVGSGSCRDKGNDKNSDTKNDANRDKSYEQSSEQCRDKSRIAVINIHPESDYLSHSIGPELASRGYTVLCANTRDACGSLASKIFDVGIGMKYVKNLPEISKIVICGHSGGASLMSAYQNLAENGVRTFQGDEKLIKCPDYLDGLQPADGFLSLDSNWGLGAMRLFGLDPAVTNEQSGLLIDEELNMFNPANGYDPSGSTYSDVFLRKFFKAQSDRNNKLIDFALERNTLIDSGKGLYADDEPMIVPGAMYIGPNNKLFPQDIRFLCRTRAERTLVHTGGRTSVEVVHSLRKPKNGGSLTGSLYRGALHTTVKKFLDSHAVRTVDGYGYDDAEVFGIDWQSSYNCVCGNVTGVTVPVLALGMTANWEFSAVETIYNNAGSSDKSMGFIEGADHDFNTDKTCERFDGEFGDTVRTTYDYIDKWLSAPGRFM